MVVALLLIRAPLTAMTDPGGGKSLWQVAVFGFAVLAGLGVYLLAAWALRVQELTELTARFRLGERARRLRSLLRRR